MSNLSSNSAPTKRGRGRPKLPQSDLQEPSTVQALERGLGLLKILSKCDSASLSDLSLQIGVPASTAYRLLHTLLKLEFVAFNESTQEWSIGVEAFAVGSGFFNRSNLIDAARTVMRKLMLETDETSNLAILSDSGFVTFLTQVETNNPIRAFHLPGTRSHAHSAGIGKALLAEFSREQVERVLHKNGLQSFTPNTLTAPAKLFENLEESFKRGWAFDDEERHVGMRCIAAAIHNSRGEAIAGVSISGPTARFPDESLPVLGLKVRQAAMDITHMTGGKVQDYEARRKMLNARSA